MGTIGPLKDMEECKELKESRKNSHVLVHTGWSDTHVAGRTFGNGYGKTRLFVII